MKFGIAVKEKIARVIAEYFTTNEIVNVFTDANINADKTLFAKWRITLDAFGKMSDPEAGIPHILEALCHPLNFEDQQIRKSFIKKLNGILAYEKLSIKSTDETAMVVAADGRPVSATPFTSTPSKTSTDYILEAINFFKNEYNKVRMSGLTYEYSIGENARSQQTDQDADDYAARLKAIERLKEIGFITVFTIEDRVENEGYYIWDYAVCKIDESKITQQTEAPRATDEGVQQLAQKIIRHEHTHRFENGGGELPIKMEITKIPELQVRNVEDSTIVKGKKHIRLPKFKPTDWAKITVRFIDERNVLINADKKEQVVADYEALGFADERRDKPNSAWMFLFGLAKNNGSTVQLPKPIPNSIKQQKKQLSDRLKTIFKNDTDPFYYATDTGVYRVKINLLPPIETKESDALGTSEYLEETMTEVYEE